MGWLDKLFKKKEEEKKTYGSFYRDEQSFPIPIVIPKERGVPKETEFYKSEPIESFHIPPKESFHMTPKEDTSQFAPLPSHQRKRIHRHSQVIPLERQELHDVPTDFGEKIKNVPYDFKPIRNFDVTVICWRCRKKYLPSSTLSFGTGRSGCPFCGAFMKRKVN